MEDNEHLPYVLELPMSNAVRIGDLPGLMAAAMHRSEFAQEAAADGIWRDLCAMVKAGTLQPLSALTMGPHELPIGEGLRRAVVLPYSLRPMLKARGIDLRLIEPGNGPTYWSLASASRCIGKAQGWSNRQVETLCAQMLDAARSESLTVRHPHTDLPVPLHERATVRDFYELVTRDDVNVWLESIDAPFRWVTDEQSAAEPRYIAGRRLWTLKDAIAAVAAMPDFGVSADALHARIAGEWKNRTCALTLRSREDGAARKVGHLDAGVPHVALLYAEDFNVWLEAAGYPEPFRLRDVAARDLADEPRAKELRQTWWDISGPYIAERLGAGQFATAKALFNALHDAAGSPESPFDKGTGEHRGSLFVRELSKPISLKTIQNAWPQIRAAAKT